MTVLSLWQCDDGTFDIVEQCDSCGHKITVHENVNEKTLASNHVMAAEAEDLLHTVMTVWRMIPADVGLRIGAWLDKRESTRTKS